LVADLDGTEGATKSLLEDAFGAISVRYGIS